MICHSFSIYAPQVHDYEGDITEECYNLMSTVSGGRRWSVKHSVKGKTGLREPNQRCASPGTDGLIPRLTGL